MSIKVLLIGAGPVSSLLAYNIKKCTKLNQLLDIYIWENTNSFGGRFSTLRYKNISGDLGAQYLSQTKGQLWSEPYFNDLLKFGLLQKLDPCEIHGFRQDNTKEHFIFTKGASSIVEYFFNDACVVPRITFNKKISSLEIGGSEKTDVTVWNENVITNFDIIISTIPIPEFLKLHISDSIWKDHHDLKLNLSEVKYTSRFAVVLFFDQQIELIQDEKYINFIRKIDNPICYWILKQGEQFSLIVLHTNINFGLEYIEEDLEKVQTIILEKAYLEIKSIQHLVPNNVKCHRWKYSQVETPYKESPGFLEISRVPHIILAGDGFTYSGFEGCILSAQKTTDYLRQTLA